jgi:hypothetical protein
MFLGKTTTSNMFSKNNKKKMIEQKQQQQKKKLGADAVSFLFFVAIRKRIKRRK